MEIKVSNVELASVREFRPLFLQESNFQFIYNKCHENNWADTWLFTINGEKAGYGSVWGAERREDRDAIFEFYLTEPFRRWANLVFEQFIAASGTTIIECQSNDRLLSSMLYEYASDINAEAILFEDDHQSDLAIPDVVFGREESAATTGNDAGGYFLKLNGEVVATGGFMLNYNWPYADIYMEVKEPFRQQGLGSLIIHELKEDIYLMDRVPSARCNVNNHASKATLLKAGFRVCGAILKGRIKDKPV
ncbi:MAG: GNAT family N-acetyltransferase [Mucilaginibacter sp.]